ncbi:tail assembly protein [Dickeya fangzhongdai]|uniref:tail assembly protein n=1 Tax=Dickeya fangzhongdai TaxID=1778540 RepID=UPI0023E3E92D|nr:tail assembly protein [Dickeya fangzhongdai]WES90505.1 tail assembly protein [Dickeya fangzhongdai]
MKVAIEYQPLRNIRLYGVLGTTFGRVHRLAVATPHEAIRALCVLLPGFEAYLNTSKRRGLIYAIFSGKTNISADELEADHGSGDIRIAPVITGSKQAGLFQVIAGAALAALMWWNPLGWSAATVAAGYMAAGSMAVGGVIQMLSPQARGLAISESADNKASYAFGSVKNTAAQGYPVPLLYGKRRIGGAIISAGIYVEDQL